MSHSRELAKQALGPGDRWAHVQLVAQLLNRWVGDSSSAEVLLAAAWLHDIGYSLGLRQTGMHALDGATFLIRSGAPPQVVSLVAFHTGAEFEAEERGLVDDLLRIERPPQDSLDVLILADLLSGPSGEQVTVMQRLNEITQRYESQHPVHRAVLRSRPYLEECASRAAKVMDYPI